MKKLLITIITLCLPFCAFAADAEKTDPKDSKALLENIIFRANQMVDYSAEKIPAILDTIQKETPAIIDEYLVYCSIEHITKIVWCMMLILLALGMGFYARWSIRLASKDDWDNDCIGINAIFSTIIAVIIMLVSMVTFMNVVPLSTSELVKIKYTPRIYLIDKISNKITH